MIFCVLLAEKTVFFCFDREKFPPGENLSVAGTAYALEAWS